MNINNDGLELVKDFEGFRTVAYLDSVGVPTIGYGHTKDVQLGDVCTEELATEWLREDIAEAENCVNNAVTVPLTEFEFSALVSWVFNLGCGTFRKSSVLRYLNESNYDKAAEYMLKYDKAGGQQLAGLTRRREAEVQLFERAV